MKKFYEEPEIVINEFSLTEDILGNSKVETDLQETVQEVTDTFDW